MDGTHVGKDIFYRKKSLKATQTCIQDPFSRFVTFTVDGAGAMENA